MLLFKFFETALVQSLIFYIIDNNNMCYDGCKSLFTKAKN